MRNFLYLSGITGRLPMSAAPAMPLNHVIGWWLPFWGLFASLLLTACASGPAVKGPDQLPIRRVVLYRNGVAYFERTGRFEGSQLRFDVRNSEVGDFLSSLAAIERTPGGIQSVFFEAPKPRAPAPVSTPATFRRLPEDNGNQPREELQPEEAQDDPRNTVTLRFQGDREHDVTVAYVVGAPIWRPTYRAIIDADDVLLQAWAVIQNISGEDWRDVALSMTTGAPVAFRSDLGTPIVPERPTVTDTGEVIASVPLSETTLAQDQSAPSPPPAPMASAAAAEFNVAAMEDESEAREESVSSSNKMEKAARSRGESEKKMAKPQIAQKAMRAPSGAGITARQAQQSVSSIAALAVLGEGVTRFDIPSPVTVPNGGSTMVAILSQRVPGQEAHLYAPDIGVPTSQAHPFRVIRFKNSTGAVLERGSIAVLGKGAFLGQGVLDNLPREATAFVPFAVDRSVAVEPSHTFDEAEGRLVRVTRNQVIIERFSQRVTKYSIRNGGADPVKMFVRHPRITGAILYQPPAQTEMTIGNALVPVTVAAHGAVELKVDERTPVERTVEFMDSLAADAVALYLSGPAIDAAQGPALKKALEIRAQLLGAQTRLEAATAERDKLAESAEETRDNLRSIKKIDAAADLRVRLVKRLGELDTRMNELTRAMVEAQLQTNELRVRLSEALQDVSLEVKSP
jgi:hypothetical protein